MGETNFHLNGKCGNFLSTFLCAFVWSLTNRNYYFSLPWLWLFTKMKFSSALNDNKFSFVLPFTVCWSCMLMHACEFKCAFMHVLYGRKRLPLGEKRHVSWYLHLVLYFDSCLTYKVFFLKKKTSYSLLMHKKKTRYLLSAVASIFNINLVKISQGLTPKLTKNWAELFVVWVFSHTEQS